jgi:hypothetical protein
MEAAAQHIGTNPRSRTINQVYRAVQRSSRLLDKPHKTLQRIDATREGIAELKKDGHDHHIPHYVRRALVDGQPCPKKFLQSAIG